MPNRRIFPDHPLTVSESNRRRKGKCLRLGICTYCNRPNDRAPKICCSSCKEEQSKQAIEQRRQFKIACFEAYGGAICCCCKETILDFLTLDHFTVHKRNFKERGGERFYRELRKLGYPPGFRVLCFNCNAGRWIHGGTCPHEESR